MSNKSILFFSYWYPNKANSSFGIFIKRHAQAIQVENNIQVLAISILKGPGLFKKSIAVYKDESGIQTHHLYLESSFNKLLYVLLPLHYLIAKKYIRKSIQPHFSFKIIHSNVLFPCAIVGYWLSKHFKTKHYISEHWSKIDKFFKRSIYAHSGKKTLESAQGISCVSELLAVTVRPHTGNPHIQIIPNVIDSTRFYYDASIQKNEVFTFIAVAHWTIPKNPFLYTEALKQLVVDKKIENFKLVLIGSGPLLDAIKEKDYPYPIEYKGNMDANDLRLELNKSHVFLHGSDYETFSVVIAEALMCGLPCLLSPVGIAKEVINADNGFVTDTTLKDWTEKLLIMRSATYYYHTISKSLGNRYDLQSVATAFSKMYKI